MKKTVGAVLLGIIIIGGAIAYWQWTKTPKYSLNQIIKSVENKDATTFQKHVDVNSVASRLVDDLSGQIFSESANELGEFGSAMGEGLLQMMKPRLVGMIEEQTLRYVERGTLWDSDIELESDEVQDLEIDNITDDIGVDQGNFQGIDYVRKDGKTAYVGLQFQNLEFNENITLEVMMRDLGGYWQVAELSNMKGVLEKIDRLQAEKLAAANAPIREDIENAIQIAVTQKSTSESEWGFSQFVELTLEIENLSDKQIRSLGAIVEVENLNGEKITDIRIGDELNIQPKEQVSRVLESEVNMFDASMTELYETEESDLEYLITINKITFVNGEELQVYDSYSDLP